MNRSKSILNVPVTNELELKTENGAVVVSSRVVAERFGKKHSHVLRTIQEKIEINPKLDSSDYFIESTYTDGANRQSKEYLLTRDGFTFIVMGFTGVEADHWKLKYIEAFNQMEKAIQAGVIGQLEKSQSMLMERFNVFTSTLSEKLNKLEQQAEFNHRPTHATKLNWNKVIKTYSKCQADEESIKHIVFAKFSISKWEDLTSDKFTEVFGYIREIAEKANLINQVSLFESNK